MYTEKQLSDELYENVCKCYYVKMPLLRSVVKEEITFDEFENQVRENSWARSSEELEKQVSGVLSEVKSIMERLKASGGIEKDPVDVAMELRKQSKGSKPSKEALDIIRPYLQDHPDDTKAIESFGWIMYDFIKSYEDNLDRYQKALSFLNKNAHFCNERIMNQPGKLVLLPKSYLGSFMRVIKANPSFADRLLPDIIDFVEAKDDFLRSGDDESWQSARYLYQSLIGKLSTENQLLLFRTLGVHWLSSEDYLIKSSDNSAQSHENRLCFAETVLNNYAKLLLDNPSSSKEYQDMVDSLIREIAYHNKRSGSRFHYTAYYLAKIYLSVGKPQEAMKAAVRFISMHKKKSYAWQLLADCSEGENKLAFLCAALLCDDPENMKLGIQREAIPLFVENKLFSSACFEVDAFETAYGSNNDWQTQKPLIASWKASGWYQTNKSAGSREPLKPYVEKATGILASYLPTVQIFTEYVNKEKGAVSFLFKVGETYRQGFFYIDSCGIPDVKLHKVYIAKLEQNKKKPNLYNIYKLCEFPENQTTFIREDHGTICLPEHGDFAFVSSSSTLDGNTYIPAKLVKQYNLDEAIEIYYEKVMSWDKKRYSIGWTMTRIIEKE